MTIVGEMTHLELNDLSCIPREDAPMQRKSLAHTRARAFGQPCQKYEELQEAVITYTAKAAE